MNESNKPEGGLSYRDAGVDIDAGNEFIERIKPAVRTTVQPGVITGIGGFGGLFELDTRQYSNPVLVAGTDGVGTKLMLARQMESHGSIGIDLVAMCVNDILACGAQPLFFLDYFATGALNLETATQVVEGIAEGCRQAGCALIGGETAEMPGMYGAGEYDLAGFAVGVVERDRLIDGSRVTAGHRVLGLESSGPHSNGYSLIRRVLEVSGGDPGQPLPQAGCSLGQALMAPTRIYVKTVLGLLQSCRIDGIAHITGGGLTENISRVLPAGLGLEIDLGAWERPAVFDWLQEHGSIRPEEMLRTFNCGIGLALLAGPDQARRIQGRLRDQNEKVHDIGRVLTAKPGDAPVRYLRQ